jgi:hypothetical protein
MDSFIRNAFQLKGFDEVYDYRQVGPRRWVVRLGCSWLSVYWEAEVSVSRSGRISTKEISNPY